jgi:uncharacterized membrane protein
MAELMAPGSTTPQRRTLGLEPNISAVLTYLILLPPITPLILLLLERDDRYTRFHAWQSFFLGTIFALLIFSFEMLASTASLFSHPLEVLFNALILTTSVGAFGLWILLLIRAYQGATVKLPIIGDEAARRAWRD